MERPTLSIVVPVFNERESLEPFFAEVLPVMDSLGAPCEMLLIDDASSDGTKEQIRRLVRRDARVRGIRLLRNSSKGGALEIGFRESRGETIVTIDADLQDDPGEIPSLLAELERGADAVIGWKRHRKDPLCRRTSSFLINFVASTMSGRKIRDMNSGLKAYRTSVVRSLAIPGSLYRFIPLLLLSKGYHVTEVPVHHRERRFGRSKFGFLHRLRGAFDLGTVLFLWKFGERPLHFFGGCGLLLFLAGAGIGSYLTILWIQGQGIGGRPLLLLSVLLMIFGIQLVSTGLIGELLLHSQDRSRHLPPYTHLS
jgi:glycosyltransferase involved in cell wall biosynthesis